MVGLEIGSSALLFKQEFDEAVKQAALAGGVSYLNAENQLVALGLAVNWGVRLLLAYAWECCRSMTASERRTLATSATSAFGSVRATASASSS